MVPSELLWSRALVGCVSREGLMEKGATMEVRKAQDCRGCSCVRGSSQRGMDADLAGEEREVLRSWGEGGGQVNTVTCQRWRSSGSQQREQPSIKAYELMSSIVRPSFCRTRRAPS